MDVTSIFELLQESSKTITSQVELEKVVQRVTDIGTKMVRAQFGAFFYNVTNERGENLVLYTISGVPKEAFSKFPMPRNTKIFEPTFSATGTVRYDDVTKESHYGQNAPYSGMPKGHLPVKSYLAVPVVSPITGEAIGGLFFGHSEPAVFTKESEILIEGVALQAAIAMGNARLFEEKNQSEKRLSEQKEQYLSIFKAASDSLIVYDEDGTIVEANPAACKIFGYSHNEIIGTNASKLFDQPKDFLTLKEIAFSGREYSGTNTRVKKDGTRFEVEFKGTYFFYKGRPHVLSAAHDLTREKQTREALQKSEEFAQVLSDSSPITLWMTDHAGQAIFFNKTWLDWVGGTKEDHIGTGWTKFIFPEDRNRTYQEFTEALAARKVFSSDFRIKRKNGEIRWCTSHGSPFFESGGKFGGYAGSLMDITERKLVEEKLAMQNLLIKTITNNALQGLFLMDARQRCTYMNPAAELMTGYRTEEVQEKPLHYYIHHTHPDGRHFPIEDCPIDRALPTQHQTQGEATFIHKNGTFYPVAFVASPIIENGTPTGTVIEVRDITREKQMREDLRNQEEHSKVMLEQKVQERTEELERSNFELLQFTSVASHDLKEPVRKIAVFSKMLESKIMDKLDATTSRYLNSIITSSERMVHLIDDLLTLSRISQLQLDYQQVPLNQILRSIQDDLEIAIQEKHATVEVKGTLPVVDGISFLMGQVFQNLISNSLKFSHPDKPPVIRISTEPSEIGGRKGYQITYSDNGIGFGPDQAEKIFEVFYRLHPRERYEGTGVGLAIVKKILTLHKGSIHASSDGISGAKFEIWLPEHMNEEPVLSDN